MSTKTESLTSLDAMLAHAKTLPRPTDAELRAQGESLARNYKPGPRQAMAMRPKPFHKPRFITFTGLDDRTDLARAHALARKYPIEWGCLIGGKLGKNRYPKIDTIQHAGKHMRTALHVCKEQAEFVNRGNVHPEQWGFDRIQVNMPTGKYNIPMLEFAVHSNKMHIIMQTRTGFAKQPEGSKLFQLFDQSGGRGKSPTSYPRAPDARLVGYAGGISAANVEAVLHAIHAENFWIDMESGVRDEDDWLDLDKCEAVCRAVYGR